MFTTIRFPYYLFNFTLLTINFAVQLKKERIISNYHFKLINYSLQLDFLFRYFFIFLKKLMFSIKF